MVVARGLTGFARDQRGISLTEAMIAMPIVILICAAMVEFGLAIFQWSQSVKAAQIGARLAAVSSPIVGDTAYAGLTSDYGTIPEGDPTPASIITVSCGAGGAACDTARLTRIVTGGDGACGTITPLVGMCDVAPWLRNENIRISYYRSGLGYVGRPNGPVTNITVELRNVTFDFFILDRLLPGLNDIEIPSSPVSITSEDVNDCRDTCP